MTGCLQPKLWEAKEDGWTERARQTVQLSADPEDPMSLQNVAEFRPFPGLEYRMVGCSGPAFRDLDILVYDGDDTLLARDGQPGRDPVVTVPGDLSRKLRIRLFAASLDAETEEAAVLILAR